MVNHRLPARRIQATVIGTICALTLVSCSENKPRQPQQRASATSVCDGAFDTQAAQALRSISDATRFREIKLDSISGTFAQLVQDLKAKAEDSDSDLGRDLCQFYAVGGKIDSPIQVNFDWVPADDGDPSPASESSETATAYTFARYTKSTDNYAWISFRCTRDRGNQNTSEPSYLTATVRTYPPESTDSAGSKSLREANIRLAYSASVKAAKKIGCLKESGLPKELEGLKARPLATK
ncbi:hypothetical protein OG762_32485 [Streptomyces sp. NBC_01136]|uniref:hypothetical protein n=1 Tax=unclassified Streptomyces TaxID=2593676 RepID=UPI0032515444|nr:hypothetical protein OG762_32485 [Streptomyces sp. NBC_01136]